MPWREHRTERREHGAPECLGVAARIRVVAEQHQRVVRVGGSELRDRRAGRIELRAGVTDVARERKSRGGRRAVNNVGIPLLRTRFPMREVGNNLARVPNARKDQPENDERAGREEESGDRAVHPSHGTAARIVACCRTTECTCASW